MLDEEPRLGFSQTGVPRQSGLSILQMPRPSWGCCDRIGRKMPFRPRAIPKARPRQVVPDRAQKTAFLEATGLFPSGACALVRGSALPTAGVTTHPGCAVRVSLTPTGRKCQAHARDEENPATGWLEKAGAAVEDQDETDSPVTPRQSRTALPWLPKGENKDIEKPVQKMPCLPASFSPAKGAAPPNSDITPWTGASQSKASFHTSFTPMVSILHKAAPGSRTTPPAFCGFSPDLEGKAPPAEGEPRPGAKLPQGRSKQKGRGRGLPRRFKSKLQGMKLPPVPSITALNFSRNFTFSFFELPPHQSHQQRVQRQELLGLVMKQLQ